MKAAPVLCTFAIDQSKSVAGGRAHRTYRLNGVALRTPLLEKLCSFADVTHVVLLAANGSGVAWRGVAWRVRKMEKSVQVMMDLLLRARRHPHMRPPCQSKPAIYCSSRLV